MTSFRRHGACFSRFFRIFVHSKQTIATMEFEGTVYKIMPVTKGTSARGDWQRQDVVFEMQDGPYTRKICDTIFNRLFFFYNYYILYLSMS